MNENFFKNFLSLAHFEDDSTSIKFMYIMHIMYNAYHIYNHKVYNLQKTCPTTADLVKINLIISTYLLVVTTSTLNTG